MTPELQKGLIFACILENIIFPIFRIVPTEQNSTIMTKQAFDDLTENGGKLQTYSSSIKRSTKDFSLKSVDLDRQIQLIM